MHFGLGCFRFARRYSGNRFCFLFLQLLRCFNSLRSLAPPYGFRWPYTGLPHSEIFGSRLTSSSPKRIVGNHVLLRLCVPRYPPLALISLTTNSWQILMSVYFLNFNLMGFHPSAKVSVLLPDKLLCSFQGSDWINPAGYLGHAYTGTPLNSC